MIRKTYNSNIPNYEFLSDMDIRKLRSIIAVADRGTFHAAADALGLTQSAVSQHVKALEEELDVRLFDRTEKPVGVTERGRMLVEKARAIVAMCEDTVSSVSGDRLSGLLMLGVMRSAVAKRLIDVLAILRRRYPQLDIRVVSEDTGDLAKGVASGRLDAAIMPSEVETDASLVWMPYEEESLAVISPVGTKGRTDAELLSGNPYIHFSRRSAIAAKIDNEIRRRAIPVETAMEIDFFPAIRFLVASGLGVSVVPQQMVDQPLLDAVQSVPFGEPTLVRTIGIIEKRTNPKSAIVHALRRELWMAAGSPKIGSHDFIPVKTVQ